MTEPSNFRLKDGRTITIDNKDVQRIRILNDIVWEKTKATSLSIKKFWPSDLFAVNLYDLIVS